MEEALIARGPTAKPARSLCHRLVHVHRVSLWSSRCTNGPRADVSAGLPDCLVRMLLVPVHVQSGEIR